jgi:hypothetical protein
MAIAADEGRQAPSPILSSSNLNRPNSMAAPSAPATSRPSSDPPRTPPPPAAANTTAAGVTSLGDSGTCCVCLDARAIYGFIHTEGVCVDLCAECAGDYLRRGDKKCPVCRQDGEIKKIFIH